MPPKPKLLSFDQLKADKGLAFSRRRLNQLIAEGKFPQPVRPGGAANARPAWVEQEIDAHIADLVASRDAGARKARRAGAHR